MELVEHLQEAADNETFNSLSLRGRVSTASMTSAFLTNMFVVRYSRTSRAQRNIPIVQLAYTSRMGFYHNKPSAFLVSRISSSLSSASVIPI